MSTRPKARRRPVRRVGLVTRTTSGEAIHITRRLDQIVDVIREGYARIYMGAYAGAETGRSRAG